MTDLKQPQTSASVSTSNSASTSQNSEHHEHIDQINWLRRSVRDAAARQLTGPRRTNIAQLEPDVRHVFLPADRASVRERAEMEKQVRAEGIAAGRFRVSNSPYGSGVHTIRCEI
jgi:hypothetical protein